MLDDFPGDTRIVTMEPSLDTMREVIQRRLNFFEERQNAVPGSLIKITDEAYQALADVSQSSPGLAIEVISMVFKSIKQSDVNDLPYVITEEHITELGLTYDQLSEFWDSPLREAVVLQVEPWHEQE